ncbi:MAG: winged helix-turn-helix domain-containing protein [Acetobacteraceae bacterium]|nr:winged helix-turn-helix domain-containing protein [Acetobacteraceae bacterium]
MKSHEKKCYGSHVNPSSEASASVEFGRFRILPHRREVLSDGRPVELGGRAFDLLLALIEANGAVVSKDQLISRVWPSQIVEEGNLRAQIRALRRAFADPDLVRTVAGRGYQFTAEVRWGGRAGTAPEAANGAPAAAPRLSIVVLPFVSLGDDQEQQYFADGVTEDLTTDLSRLADMAVISRNTAFTYRNRTADTKLIGRELGVRYVLGGSVQRSGHQVRASAQLADTVTDTLLWADRLVSDSDNLLALQNELTSRIAIALNVELVGAEVARPVLQPDALDYVLRARALYLGKVPTRRNYAEQIALYERALALDPGSAKVQSFLAWQLAARVLDQMTDTASSDIVRAETLADRAMETLPRTALAYYAKAQVLRVQQRFEEAGAAYETVLTLNRNWVHAIAALGHCKFMTGSIGEVIPAQERAIRLSPRDPKIWLYYYWIGQAHLLQSRVDEATLWFERARSANPEHPLPHAYLASSYALNGENARAAPELVQARRLCGDDRYSSIARLKAVGPFGGPKTRALFEATYLVGLRKAGMAER